MSGLTGDEKYFSEIVPVFSALNALDGWQVLGVTKTAPDGDEEITVIASCTYGKKKTRRVHEAVLAALVDPEHDSLPDGYDVVIEHDDSLSVKFEGRTTEELRKFGNAFLSHAGLQLAEPQAS